MTVKFEDIYVESGVNTEILASLFPHLSAIGGYLYEGPRSLKDAARWAHNHLGVIYDEHDILDVFNRTDFLSHAMFALNHDREYMMKAANSLNKMLEADRTALEIMFGMNTVASQKLIGTEAYCFPAGDKVMINALGLIMGALPIQSKTPASMLAAHYQGGRLVGFKVVNCKQEPEQDQETEQL